MRPGERAGQVEHEHVGEGTVSHGPTLVDIPEGGFDEAARFGNWKAVRHDRGTTELYRLNQDLAESDDVAKRFPSVVRKAERIMAEAVS